MALVPEAVLCGRALIDTLFMRLCLEDILDDGPTGIGTALDIIPRAIFPFVELSVVFCHLANYHKVVNVMFTYCQGMIGL
jgi:hypothetical protein